MSITGKYFKKIHFQAAPVKIQGRKACRSLRKCGNCIHAQITRKYPNDGLLNEYWCEEKKCKVLNREVGCSCFDNRWRKRVSVSSKIKHERVRSRKHSEEAK